MIKYTFKYTFYLRILSYLILFNSFCCQSKLIEYEYHDFIFGSYIRFKVWVSDTNAAHNAISRAMQELKHIDSVASVFNPNSEVSIINKNGYGKMSDDLKKIILKSLEVSENSQGAFDITVGSALKAYGFYDRNQLTKSEKIMPLESVVGYKNIVIRDDSIFLKPNMAIDLGGVAVGYALDKISNILKLAGIKSGLIDAGGDIICFGEKVYNIGVKNPNGNGIIKTIQVKNQAISTSGNYEKFYNQDDVKYCHIINPKTSKPIDNAPNSLSSVTIITNNCVDADAYATAVFVLGLADGQNLIRRLKYRGILIANDGTIVEVNN